MSDDKWAKTAIVGIYLLLLGFIIVQGFTLEKMRVKTQMKLDAIERNIDRIKAECKPGGIR